MYVYYFSVLGKLLLQMQTKPVLLANIREYKKHKINYIEKLLLFPYENLLMIFHIIQ